MSASSTDSPALILLSANRRKVPVCGKSLEAALWAAALVDTVLRRGTDIPLPSSRDGGTTMVRVTAKVVGQFLFNVYSDDPAAVSEAVMALRKYDPARASWLLHVLTTTPELVGLARAVHVELTGEEKGYEGLAG
jgi:hypothetical protein